VTKPPRGPCNNMPICNAMEGGCRILAQWHAELEASWNSLLCSSAAMCPAFGQFEGVEKGFLPAADARFCCSHGQAALLQSE
jgi:hypothetical protein